MSIPTWSGNRRWIVLPVLAVFGVTVWATAAWWRPLVARQVEAGRTWFAGGGAVRPNGESANDHPPADDAREPEPDGHDHAGHDDATTLTLSRQAQKSMGLRIGTVKKGTFVRTITVPGIIVERRGLTKRRVVAPLTGIVTEVHIIEGEALHPGQPLFGLRMTHEDLLQSQVEFLRILEELDVVRREAERLRPAAEKGAIPQKTLLDRLYEQQKLEAGLRAQRESLLLHGLSAAQVDQISQSRALRSDVTVFAPGQRPPATREPAAPASVPAASAAGEPNVAAGESDPDQAPPDDTVYVVSEVTAENGRLVTAGDPLLTLADYSELYIEGDAFEQDGQAVADALRQRWKVAATVENRHPSGTTVRGLPILYLSDEVDPQSRTLHFYLPLKNERVRDETADGHRFINWRFKPGQRTHLRIPVEEWPDRIILPADAVAQDGPESYVFLQDGDHFDRRAVRIEHLDLESAVIAPDGSLFPGDRVALTGAQQMLMALKSKSGGAVDPHAGHSH